MWKWLFLSVVLMLVLLGIALFGSRTVLLMSGGGGVAVANEPAGPPWRDQVVTFNIGGSDVFAVRKDFFDGPLFLYSFSDTRRFLCVYDYDISVLAFIVDCGVASTNTASQLHWPADENMREQLERGTTNVVISSKGVVRLPTYAELQEVSTKVKAWTPQQFKVACFPIVDLGFCRFRFSDKDFVLRVLDTNRHSPWPTK